MYEIVGYKGLCELIGSDYKDFLLGLHAMLSETNREALAERAERYGWDMLKAMDEWLAEICVGRKFPRYGKARAEEDRNRLQGILSEGRQVVSPMVANPNGEETPVGVWLDARTNKRVTLICSLRILSGHRLNMPMKVMIRYLIGI